MHDQRSVLHCQEVLQRFATNGTLQRKQEILRMVLKLSELSSRNEEGTSTYKQISQAFFGKSARKT